MKLPWIGALISLTMLALTGGEGLQCYEPPLPIQLASFTGARVDSSGYSWVQLRWTTISETNNYGFWIQRNGITLDESFVAGNGTTLEVHQYAYKDINPPKYQVNEYRLLQMDLDGTAHLSDRIIISPSKVESNSAQSK